MVRQLRPLVPGQPWGIFLVEFADSQVYRVALRRILRGLVPSRRGQPDLKGWQHENLLFICATADYERITFAHFRGAKAQRARLATFGWRRGSQYLRTLFEHNLPYLSWPDDDAVDAAAWLEQWARAFDKEQVTNKFFADFRGVFDRVAHEIASRHPRWTKETVEREVQTLLNRLLFLYFVQRKGWLNRERDYLVRHFREHLSRSPQGLTYINEFLRPLFVKLSTKGSQAAIPGHDLPFLNGGLFADEYGAEHWDDEVKRHHQLEVGNNVFQHVFDDLLEAYNFTVREDTPLDVDVAIDPEMLGKIFESLVLQLESSGSGGKSSRHDTGSFYTPRPIVHYLCREGIAAWFEEQPHFAERENPRQRIDMLLALDISEGLDPEARAKLDSLLTSEQARTLADQLYDLRACDPAVGSGAFPVALLHELVNLARLWETRARGKDPTSTDPGWLFDIKMRLIERVLYGVDVQSRAIEICKLRLWLSLVVDYPLDVDIETCERQSFRDALKKLPALPNLDFKVRRANSLIDYIHGEPVPATELGVGSKARPVLDRLIAAERAFFAANSTPEKRRLRLVIYEARAELAQLELKWARNKLGLIPDIANELKAEELERAREATAKVLAQIRDARKLKAAEQDEALEDVRAFFEDEHRPTFVWQFDFAEVFQRSLPSGGIATPENGEEALGGTSTKTTVPDASARKGFDIIVGNPPYVRIQILKQRDPEQVEWFKEHYESATKGSYDLYVVFVERALQLLQPRGQLAFILPHKFFNAKYGEPLRRLLAKGHHLRHVVHFGDQQIFAGATNYVCLLFVSKAAVTSCKWVRANDLAAWLETQQGTQAQISAQKITASEWNFAVGSGASEFERLSCMPIKLGDACSAMFVGLQTSADTVFLFKDWWHKKRGTIRVFSKALEEEVEIETEVLKDVVRSGDIGRYFAQAKAMLLFPYSVSNNEARLFATAELRDRFPLAWNYLQRNKSLLKGRENGAFADQEWYRFGRSQNLGMWERPKLMVPYMITQLGACLDVADNLYFVNVTTGGYGITTNNKYGGLTFLCALLNSPVHDFFLRRVSTSFHGGYFAANKQFIERLPIPAATNSQQQAVELFVEWLSWLYRQPTVREVHPEAPQDPLIASYLEQLVNALVYELFFPAELHASGVRFFELLNEVTLPAINTAPSESHARLKLARESFSQLSASGHPLRVGLDHMQTLDLIRIIEDGK